MSTDPFMDGLDEAPAWRPDAGGEVQGIIIAIGSRESDYGPYSVYTLRRINGNPPQLTDERIAVHMMGSVRKGWAEREQPAIGDRFGSRYNGERVPRDGGRPYHDWAMNLMRAAQVPLALQVPGLLDATPSPSGAAIPSNQGSGPQTAAPDDDEPW